MSDIWAADLQADAAAWKRHSFQMHIDERYAGIYFLATRKLQNGRHQQIQCHVTLLKSDKAMIPPTAKLLQIAQAKAAEVIEEPMKFATEKPKNLYRDDDGGLHRTLITFDVQGTTHSNLFHFRNWLVQSIGGHERKRVNFHLSVDYVFGEDCID